MKTYKTFLFVALVAVLWAVRQIALSAEPSAALIKSFEVQGPFVPFPSHGDLWLSTWADDDSVFMSWGDGLGPGWSADTAFSHNGLLKVTGEFPDVKFELVQRFMPLSDDANNSKPTSMLFLDGRLYAAIHSPLLTPNIGFIAYSDDYGKTFNYDLDAARTKTRNSNFICLIFINMGKAYDLNTDGYVYAFGTMGEINTSGKVYLTRMPKDKILDEGSWEFYSGLENDGAPKWSPEYKKAKPVKGLSSQTVTSLFPDLLFSAAYHPGIGRYIAMTAATETGSLYDAPAPWGPWTFIGTWFDAKSSDWYASYMPGIITKDMGSDYFYFTAAGRIDLEPAPGDFKYSLKIGRIKMNLK